MRTYAISRSFDFRRERRPGGSLPTGGDRRALSYQCCPPPQTPERSVAPFIRLGKSCGRRGTSPLERRGGQSFSTANVAFFTLRPSPLATRAIAGAPQGYTLGYVVCRLRRSIPTGCVFASFAEHFAPPGLVTFPEIHCVVASVPKGCRGRSTCHLDLMRFSSDLKLS